jgi:AhpD family alkylhydroperoxidase
MPLERRDEELAAVSASVGSNCDPCMKHHFAAGPEAGLSQAELDAALDVGLEVHEVRSAIKMAGYFQQHAAARTTEAVTRALGDGVGASAGRVAAN